MQSRSLKRLLPIAVAAVSALGPLSAGAVAVSPPGDLSTWNCAGICATSAADGDITLSPLANARYGYVATSGSSAYGASPLALDANSRGSGAEANGSRVVSGSFHANASDHLDIHFNYVSTDGKGYDDYAWARLLNAADDSLVAWLYTARSSNSNTKGIVPGDVVDKHEFDPDEMIVDYKDFEFHSKTASDPVDWSPLGGSNGSCWEDNAAGCGYTGWLQSSYAFAGAGDYRVEIGVVNWGDEAFDSGLAFDFAHLAAPVPEPATLHLTLAALALFGFLGRRRLAKARPG